MLGMFQQSQMRIEVLGSQQQLRDALLHPHPWLQMWYQSGIPTVLSPGLTFTTWLGWVPIQHQVEFLGNHQLRFLLSQGIDGFHDWQWGEGWVQSHLEGISLLPLNLGQTVTLMQLRRYVQQPHRSA